MAFSRNEIDQFCAKAKELQAARVIPDFVLSIIHPSGNVVLANGLKTNEQTLFPIGSLSKAFAATLIARLIDKNLLSWNDSIRKFVKIDMPEDFDLSIRQLLSHINPLPEHALTQVSEFGFSRQELIKKLKHIKREKTFKFSYQNVLFSVIADIVEKVTGKTFADCLRKEILIPLDMSSITLEEKEYLAQDNKAQPHIKEDGKIALVPYSPYWHVLGPASCVSASIADLTRWLKFNLQIEQSSLLSKASLTVIQRPLIGASPPYAMGWWEADEKGLVLCHTGSVTGFESAIAMIPEWQIGIVVCSNVSGESFTYEVVNDFIRQVINEKTFSCTNVLKLQMPRSQPTLPLDKFVGDFYDLILENISVRKKEDVLMLEIGKNKMLATLSPITLLACHTNISPELAQLAPHYCFQISWQGKMEAAGKVYYDDDKIAFVQNEKGVVEKVILFLKDVSHVPMVCERSKIANVKDVLIRNGAIHFFASKTDLEDKTESRVERPLSSNAVGGEGQGEEVITVATTIASSPQPSPSAKSARGEGVN